MVRLSDAFIAPSTRLRVLKKLHATPTAARMVPGHRQARHGFSDRLAGIQSTEHFKWIRACLSGVEFVKSQGEGE